MSKNGRRKFSTEQKAAILRRHIGDKVPVSNLCDEYELNPSQLYGWQRQLMDNMAVALETSKDRRVASAKETRLNRENEILKAKLSKKDNIIAEISEEYVKLKKELGEL